MSGTGTLWLETLFFKTKSSLSLVEDVGAEELESGSLDQIFKKCSNVSELISELRKYFDL